MTYTLSSVFLLGSLLLSGASAGTQGWTPEGVTVSSISYEGTGCPQGSGGVVLPVGGNRMVLKFDDVYVRTGPGVQVTAQRKNCQINVNLGNIPAGTQYSVMSILYSGNYHLEGNVTATVKDTVYFSGRSDQSIFGQVFEGPSDEDFAFRDTLPWESTWSTCNNPTPINLGHQIRISATGTQTAESFIWTTGLYDFEVQWQNCTSTNHS